MREMTIDDLVKILKKAKKHYYSGDRGYMTDKKFDALEEQLKRLDPDNEYFSLVGSPIKSKRLKIQHEVPMLSAGKCKSPEDAWNWVKKIEMVGNAIIAEPKIDGLSATIKYTNGKLKYIATRGDGTEGQDITHIKNYVKSIPHQIDLINECEIRGELYISKNSKIQNVENSPLRNIAVGLVNRKPDHSGISDLKFIKFIAYDVICKSIEAKTVQMTIKLLKKYQFEVVDYNVNKSLFELENSYKNYINDQRDSWDYETDGLMLIVDDRTVHDELDRSSANKHHHHYNIALKPPSEGKITKLKGIEWNVSRLGKIIPVAIVEPVVLGGAVVKRCTLNNLQNVVNLRLNKGDKVLVERANDVIPFFAKNLSHTIHEVDKNLIPTKCPSCGSKVAKEGLQLVCTNLDCSEQKYQRILYWVKACDMESFSRAAVKTLFDLQKIEYVEDLYKLTKKDLYGVEGFGQKKIDNAIHQIDSTRTMDIRQFTQRLGIPIIKEKTVKKLGINSINDLLEYKSDGSVAGNNLQEFLDDNLDTISELLECVKIVDLIEKKRTNGNTVCMTGSGPSHRNNLISVIESKGDNYSPSIDSEVNILICEDKNGSSSKLKKAVKLGIKLMNYEEYFK